ncbi:MAG: MogA/MoaB family molybdenum cofactor biosynthesis protein [Planctomycetota bacterium]
MFEGSYPAVPGGDADRLETPIRAAVLTLSDRCAAGVAEDTGGPALVDRLERLLYAEVVATAVLPDEPDQIGEQLKAWALESPNPDLILTTGGTGLSPRDRTPEGTAAVLEREHPALLELARLRCYAVTPKAALSRGACGTLGGSLIINLPGSPRGAAEMFDALVDVLPHAIETLRGDVVSDGKPVE